MPASKTASGGDLARSSRLASSLPRTFAVACLCASLSACFGDSQALYSHLDEQQANDVSASLLRSGIDADKHQLDRGTDWIVSVSKKDLPAAMAVLDAAGLPRAAHQTMGEIFKKEGFVASPTEDKARYVYALNEELSSTLQKLDGVVSARVMVALPDRDKLNEKTDSASASVVIISEPGAHVQERETDIKAIVKDAVEGLDNPDHVTVKFFTRTATQTATVPTTTGTGEDAPTTKPDMASDLARFASRSDVTRGLLIAFAGLTLLAAILLLWRSRGAIAALFGSGSKAVGTLRDGD